MQAKEDREGERTLEVDPIMLKTVDAMKRLEALTKNSPEPQPLASLGDPEVPPPPGPSLPLFSLPSTSPRTLQPSETLAYLPPGAGVGAEGG